MAKTRLSALLAEAERGEPFVVDNSVVSGWYGENQATPYTEAIAEQLLEDRTSAPAWGDLELTTMLRIACVRQRPGGSRLRRRRRVSHRTKPPNGHRMDGY